MIKGDWLIWWFSPRQLGFRARNNGQSRDMNSQIPLNVRAEFSFFWRVMQSLFSLGQLEKSLFEVLFERVAKCESDMDKRLSSYILTTITFIRYSDHHFMLTSNSTNHMFVECYPIFQLLSVLATWIRTFVHANPFHCNFVIKCISLALKTNTIQKLHE